MSKKTYTDAIAAIVKAMEGYVSRRLSKASFDRTVTGIITAMDKYNRRYTIQAEGKLHTITVPACLYEPSEQVSIRIPCNNWNVAELLDKNGKSVTIYPPSTGTSSYQYRNVFGTSFAESTITGTLKITLPESWTDTMMLFEISIYNYLTDTSAKLTCGGYNYAYGPYWCNLTAHTTSTALIKNVRFAHDGERCCILLGNTATTWAYPKISIDQILAGFYNGHLYGAGYEIHFITDESGLSYILDANLNR